MGPDSLSSTHEPLNRVASKPREVVEQAKAGRSASTKRTKVPSCDGRRSYPFAARAQGASPEGGPKLPEQPMAWRFKVCIPQPIPTHSRWCATLPNAFGAVAPQGCTLGSRRAADFRPHKRRTPRQEAAFPNAQSRQVPSRIGRGSHDRSSLARFRGSAASQLATSLPLRAQLSVQAGSGSFYAYYVEGPVVTAIAVVTAFVAGRRCATIHRDCWWHGPSSYRRAV